MRKNIVILAIATLLPIVSVQAQSEVSLTGGGGFHPLLYSFDQSKSNAAGYKVDLGFRHFFNENWGVGTGIGLTQYGASATLNFDETVETQDPENWLPYELHTSFHDINEIQKIRELEIPINLSFRFWPHDNWRLQTSLGIYVGLPIKPQLTLKSGEYTTKGYFLTTGVEYEDLPQHGFTNSSAATDEEKVEIATRRPNLGLTFDFGAMRKITDKLSFYTALYFTFGFNDIAEGHNSPILNIGERGGDLKYYGILNSAETGKVTPLAVGLKVGLNFSFQSIIILKDKKKAPIEEETPTQVVEETPEPEESTTPTDDLKWLNEWLEAVGGH